MFEIELSWHLNRVLMLNWIVWNRTDFAFNSVYCPIGWGCRIHRLHLCREVKLPPQKVSWIWHQTIWRWGSSNAGALRNAEHPFIAIAPRSILARMVAPDRFLSIGQIEVNSVLTLNWIFWNRTALTFYCELIYAYTKLNCLN